MEQTYPVAPAAEGVAIVGGCIGLVIWLVVIILTAVVFCKIFSKAGFHWALGLLMMIPIANLIMLLVLAFSTWPIQRELEMLRRNQSGGSTPPPQSPTPQDFRNV